MEHPPTPADMVATVGHLPDAEAGNVQLSNGIRDPRQYIEALAPRLFVPTHHDDWAPGLTTRGTNYRSYFYEELADVDGSARTFTRSIPRCRTKARR